LWAALDALIDAGLVEEHYDALNRVMRYCRVQPEDGVAESASTCDTA